MQSRESAAANASAFMIDLRQMATMLGGATPRTLCLIDEFGKGTNAQDGISLLYACLQHFLDRKAECPKVMRGRVGSGLVGGQAADGQTLRH